VGEAKHGAGAGFSNRRSRISPWCVEEGVGEHRLNPGCEGNLDHFFFEIGPIDDAMIFLHAGLNSFTFLTRHE
jgi:hypothetical protein